MGAGKRYRTGCICLCPYPLPPLDGRPGGRWPIEAAALAAHHPGSSRTIWPLAPARTAAHTPADARPQRYSPRRTRHHALGRGTQSYLVWHTELRCIYHPRRGGRGAEWGGDACVALCRGITHPPLPKPFPLPRPLRRLYRRGRWPCATTPRGGGVAWAL